MKWMIVASLTIAIFLASAYGQQQLGGTCASIGYSTSCCPRHTDCHATDGTCMCDDACFIIDECCSDQSPKTCADVGIYQCCTDTAPGACEVRDIISAQPPYYCSCNVSCHTRGDCCSDASTFCVNVPPIPQTCAEAGKNVGCCQWSSTSSCFVAGGNCYCDSYCYVFGDCCSDVPPNYCPTTSEIIYPPSGSVIANFEETINATTLICNIFNINSSLPRATRLESTIWSISNFRGVSNNFHVLHDDTAPEIFLFSSDPIPISGAHPKATYRNRLKILVWSNELDRVTIFCGNSTTPAQANFTLRIYRSPKLQKNLIVRIQEGDRDVTIDLHQDPPPFPESTIFNWSKDGQLLFADYSLTNSKITFPSIMRTNTGNYTVSATNFRLDDPSQQVGSDTGNFYLDVLYPPSFATEGSSKQYVLLGERYSLICGTGLDSNPQATITWTTPNGTTIMDSTLMYELENGPDVVRLNFMSITLSDAGVWICDATVSSEVSKLSGERDNDTFIGSFNVTIELMITAPSIPTIECTGSTWASISWTGPLVDDSLISYYEIITRAVDTGEIWISMSTTTNATNFNVTGFVSGISYELTIVAVSELGNITARSLESRPVVIILTATPGQTIAFIDPPNGSVIVDIEGTLNVPTITCNIVNNSRNQERTVWSISNFRGVSSFRELGEDIAPEIFQFSGNQIPQAPPTKNYQNRLKVLVLSSDLDHVMIACGNITLPVQAYFVFRIYRSPNLHKNLIVRVQDGDVDIQVDLHQGPPPFPEPSIFNWSKDGQPLPDDLNLTYSTLTFSTVTRSSAGNYMVSATNFLLENSSQQLGSDTGNFYLDVLSDKTGLDNVTVVGGLIGAICGIILIIILITVVIIFWHRKAVGNTTELRCS